MLPKLTVAAVLLSLPVVAACSAAEDADTRPAPATSNLPESYWLAQAPSGAIDIKLARKAAKDGASLVIVGRVGELLDKRAQFRLVDRSFVPCNERPEDECKTPWDYCCEDPTELANGTIVVECRQDGKLRKTTARGFHGLDHLKEVVVAGKALTDSAGNVIVVATQLHVKP